MMNTQVCIIGAGPAGAVAALQLSKLGVECVIIDKAVFPRDKVCGDAITESVLHNLTEIDSRLGQRLKEFSDKIICRGIMMSGPDGSVLEFPNSPDDYVSDDAFISKRVDFDNFLINEVKAAKGLTLLEGVKASVYTLKGDGYYITDIHGGLSIKADMLIIADGANSTFAREVGGVKIEPEHYAMGLRCYYKNVAGLNSRDYIELHFLEEVLPGYLWIFPLPNNEANVGIGMRRLDMQKKKINLKKLLQDTIVNHPLIKDRFKEATLISSISGYGLPLGSKVRKIYGERFVLVGDAASLINPFTGEGIGNAVVSGRIAAHTASRAIKSNDFSEAFLSSYNHDVYTALGSKLRIATQVQKLILRPRLFSWIFRKIARNKHLRWLIVALINQEDISVYLRSPRYLLKILLNK